MKLKCSKISTFQNRKIKRQRK